jgi:5-formyltetrahydrofolate cyclo-ligase
VGDGLLQVARSAGLLDPRGRAGPLGTITVAAYLAMPGEPDPGALVAAARASGGTVLLPIPHAGRVLGWAVDTGQHARSARLPVVVPESPEVGRGAAALLAAGVRIVLAPALAVTTDGARLGNGGGYYDTLLAQLAGRIEVMAVVHDDEVLAPGEIPTEPHDARVSAALTPTRLLRLG